MYICIERYVHIQHRKAGTTRRPPSASAPRGGGRVWKCLIKNIIILDINIIISSSIIILDISSYKCRY